MSAHLLAEARRLADEANAAHQAAISKAQAIRDRIAASQARMEGITLQRLAGHISEADTSEYTVLGGDVIGLQSMLTAAEQTIVATHPEVAQTRLRAVEAEHAREQNEIAFDLLAAQALKLEDALLACVIDLYAIGRQIKGPSLVMSWRPSTKLSRAIIPGVLL